MSSILFGRVRRLEQHHGDCPHCGGKGVMVVEYRHPALSSLHLGKPLREDRSGCPQCGRKQVIVVEYIKEDMIRR